MLAERQTAGRGRGENRWWSYDGVTFSLLLEAEGCDCRLATGRRSLWLRVWRRAARRQELVPAAEFKVKWPNDVYLNGRKICGILSESVPGTRDRLVVGIGINVNNRGSGPRSKIQGPKSEADEMRFSAASLIEHDDVCRDLTEVLLRVLDEFDGLWAEILERGFNDAAMAFRERCFLTGKMVRIEQPGGNP